MKRVLAVLALSLFVVGAVAEEPRVIKKAGEGIENGGQAVEKGLKYPVKGLRKTGDWLDKKVGKGDKKT